MLFDSNGQYLKPDKFHREDKCQYERVIKINDAVEMVKKAKINKAPKKILINVGLNDVDENTDINEMISEYKKLLSSVHEKMPESKIYLSSIFKRKDDKFTQEIEDINARLSDLENTWFIFINHTNISNIDMMYDQKHLKKKGFFTMITNLKYVLYRILPSIPTNRCSNRHTRRHQNR